MKKTYFLLFLVISIFCGIFVFSDLTYAACIATLYDGEACSGTNYVILGEGQSTSLLTSSNLPSSASFAGGGTGCTATLYNPAGTKTVTIGIDPNQSNADHSHTIDRMSAVANSVWADNGCRFTLYNSNSCGGIASGIITGTGGCQDISAIPAASGYDNPRGVDIITSGCRVTLFDNHDCPAGDSNQRKTIIAEDGTNCEAPNLGLSPIAAQVNGTDCVLTLYENEFIVGNRIILGEGYSSYIPFDNIANSVRATPGCLATFWDNIGNVGNPYNADDEGRCTAFLASNVKSSAQVRPQMCAADLGGVCCTGASSICPAVNLLTQAWDCSGTCCQLGRCQASGSICSVTGDICTDGTGNHPNTCSSDTGINIFACTATNVCTSTASTCSGCCDIGLSGAAFCDSSVCVDTDNDGYDNCTPGIEACDDGKPKDCNDSNPNINPGIVEFGTLCGNGIDENCNGSDCNPTCHDDDADSYQDVACGGNDCNDSNAYVHPGATESCTNNIDDNCNGLTDCADTLSCPECTQCQGGNRCLGGTCTTSPASETGLCSDGIDNDCDAMTDSADTDCGGSGTCDSPATAPHNTCAGGFCVSDWSCAVSTCTSNTQCCASPSTNPYNSCQMGVCQSTPGCAVSTCSSAGASCAATTTPPTGGTTTIIRIQNFLNIGSIQELMDKIINFIFTIGIALVPLMYIVAGFYFVTAAGDPQKVTTARNIMLWTTIGLGIILLARGLIAVIKSAIGG